jgi:hypothetical protein|tara:strand:- start:513 stop:1190 length:678 start_codon:yes stop_codon:yes gene_type:complete
MATRALIGYLDDSKKLTTTYNHYDGYPEYLGKVLKEHYGGDEKAKYVASVGYITSIDEDGKINSKFNESANTMILDEEAFSAAMQIGDEVNGYGADYGYVYFNDEWNTVKNNGIKGMAEQIVDELGESGMFMVDENGDGNENIMEQGYEAKWAKFLNEAKQMDFDVLKKYIKQETNYGDSEVNTYIESLQRDFEAGGDRSNGYDDYEMDDYVEDFENYIQDKRDA